MKKFYKKAYVEKTADGYAVTLDGKPVKTPLKNILLCEREAIAQEIVREWDAQGETVLPHTMPVTQLVITAIDKRQSREDRESRILNYLNTDMLFYHAAASPYKEKQAEIWLRWTDWFSKKFSVRLITTDDIIEAAQSNQAKAVLQTYINALDDFSLLVFEMVTEETSSYILSMALFEKAATVDDIYDAVFLEDMIRAEIYDEAKYGAAPDEIRRRESVSRNMKAAEKLILIFH